jgi:hypothetical protein
MAKFLIIGQWAHFPNIHPAEANNPILFWWEAMIFFGVGACFLLLSVIDMWTFIFHPFQVNCVIGLSSKKEDDQRKILNMSNNNFASVITN